MLYNNERGYATVTRDRNAYSIEDRSMETCIRYCRMDSVVVEMIPYVNGFNLRFLKWPYKLGKHFISYDKYSQSIYFWKFQVQLNKEYSHRQGKVVYDPLKDKKED